MPLSTSPPDLEVIFLGSGNSAATPEIPCVLKGTNVKGLPCRCCEPAVLPDDRGDAGGSRNARLTTSVVVRKHVGSGVFRTVLFDCGKNFRESALKFFKKNGIVKLDAVVLSHDHTDVTAGLDTLRAWTMFGAIQDHVDVYCDEPTLKGIEAATPWLVDRSRSTTSGWLPAMRFHTFERGKQVTAADLSILPVPVQHGFNKRDNTLNMICCFVIERQLIYMADASVLPPSSLEMIRREAPTPSLLMIDCDGVGQANSPHFSLRETYETALAVGAEQTMLVKMSHELCYSELMAVAAEIEGTRPAGHEQAFVDRVFGGEQGIRETVEQLKGKGKRVHPANDGLVMHFDVRK